jgi:hypothetical protein
MTFDYTGNGGCRQREGGFLFGGGVFPCSIGQMPRGSVDKLNILTRISGQIKKLSPMSCLDTQAHKLLEIRRISVEEEDAISFIGWQNKLSRFLR